MTSETLCPTCGKSAQEKFRPFCSNRCAQIDLHLWFGEAYRVPTAELPESDEVAESGEDESKK
ncbi:MAG: DNA gyrase inhibitor YacG [Alphaproteobacteria bacterium]